ncbi:MAG: hypothetical protein EOO62_17575, partial [Hymenobacter sp.]
MATGRRRPSPIWPTSARPLSSPGSGCCACPNCAMAARLLVGRRIACRLEREAIGRPERKCGKKTETNGKIPLSFLTYLLPCCSFHPVFMARQVLVTVQCAGKALAPGQDFTALVLHQTLFDHHALALTVPFDSVEGSQAAFLTKTPGQLLGQPVSVTIVPDHAFELDKGPGFNFKGVITELGTSKDSDLQSNLAVQGYSSSCLLVSGVQKRTFRQQTLQAIFSQVLAPYPENLLTRQLRPRHAAPLPYVVQYQESNFAFLSRLATEYAEWFYYDGTSLQLGPPAAGAEQDFVADGVHNTFHLGLALNATKVKFYEYNYQQHQHYAATTQGQAVPALPA